MLLEPEEQEQIRVEAGQLPAAVDAHVTTPAERDVNRGLVRARPPVVDNELLAHQPLERHTGLTAAIAREHRFPVAAKVPFRTPAPVVARAAQSAREKRLTAAGTAAPGPLRGQNAHTSLPRPPEST